MQLKYCVDVIQTCCNHFLSRKLTIARLSSAYCVLEDSTGMWVLSLVPPFPLLQSDYQLLNFIQVLKRVLLVSLEKSHLNSDSWATLKAGSPWRLSSPSRSSCPQLSTNTNDTCTTWKLCGLSEKTGQRLCQIASPHTHMPFPFWAESHSGTSNPQRPLIIFRSRTLWECGGQGVPKDPLCREKQVH